MKTLPRNSASTITVIIADDHPLVREGFVAMMKKFKEINLVAEASDGVELVKLASELRPMVIISDVKMPNMDGIRATKIIKAELPDTEVIALSMFDTADLIADMINAGAIGYLLKNADKTEIVAAINAAGNHQSYYSKEITEVLTGKIKKRVGDFLTKKEIEIIQLICKQFSNKQIAYELCLDKRTIDWHRNKILDKLDAKNTAGIVMYAAKNNIC